MYSTWGFPEFCSKGTTSFRVSLEHKQDTWGNKIRSRSRMHHLSCFFYLDITPSQTDHWSLIRESRCYLLLLGSDRDFLTTKKKQTNKRENIFQCVMIKSRPKVIAQENEVNILGLLVCQYELEDANTRPSLAFPVVGAWVQFLQCIKRFGCIVELAHLKQQAVIMSTSTQHVDSPITEPKLVWENVHKNRLVQNTDIWESNLSIYIWHIWVQKTGIPLNFVAQDWRTLSNKLWYFNKDGATVLK